MKSCYCRLLSAVLEGPDIHGGCMKSGRLHGRIRKYDGRNHRGQAAVEFALVAIVAMIVLFVAIQMAVIGQAALALGQMNYQGARFAAVNTCAVPQDVADYMGVVGSPTITTPNNCGQSLSVSLYYGGALVGKVTPSKCSGTVTPTTGCATPRQFGNAVQVNVTFNASSLIFLSTSKSNPNFLGIPFPTQLSSIETAMTE
jgi:hypothetical protein